MLKRMTSNVIDLEATSPKHAAHGEDHPCVSRGLAPKTNILESAPIEKALVKMTMPVCRAPALVMPTVATEPIQKIPDKHGLDKKDVATWLKTLPFQGAAGFVATNRAEVYARRFAAMGIEGADLERLDNDMLYEELDVKPVRDREIILDAIKAGDHLTWRQK